MVQKRGKAGLIVIVIAVLAIPAFLGCIGVLAAVAVPSFVRYQQRAKAGEARANVRVIQQGLAMALADGALTEAPRIARTPAEVPCGASQVVSWGAEDSGWATLGFSPSEPLRYPYELEPGPDGRYVIRAVGDLDCDGVHSHFELHGRIDPSTREATADPEVLVVDELE